jgi:phosphoserine phosphatase
MTQRRFYVVHGMGSDEVGLVGRITQPIAQAGGNIQDLRQDVLHGLFTIYMVVDLTDCELNPDQLRNLMKQVGDETGLQITVEPYSPVPRRPEKQNLLMILVGMDQPGIIAASSALLGKYNANIEFAQTIAREGIFLMELLTDVSHVAIPVDNLKRTIRQDLQAMGIRAIFQDRQVFNKRKRMILFHVISSFLDHSTLDEILRQAQLNPDEVAKVYDVSQATRSLQNAASRLDGLPMDVVDTVLQSIQPTAGTMELLQTLKVMGYKIALVSSGFSFVTDALRRKLDIDHAFGVPLEIDDDERVVIGELSADESASHDLAGVLSYLQTTEDIDADDITTVDDEGCDETPGIRLDFDLEILLDCFNQRVMSKQNLIGLLGSFGIPRWVKTGS